MVVLGPGGIGEGSGLVPVTRNVVKTVDILAATGPAFDAFSYHSYGGVSSRCGQLGGGSASEPGDEALSEEWLERAGRIE
jgi:hypothetical protein